MQKSPEITIKWPFPTFNTPKPVHLEDIYLKFCTRVQLIGLFYPYFVFLIQKSPPNFLKIIFLLIIFYNLHFFPNFGNKREQFARSVYSQHSAENQSLLPLNPSPHRGGVMPPPPMSFSRMTAERLGG